MTTASEPTQLGPPALRGLSVKPAFDDNHPPSKELIDDWGIFE